MNPDKRKAIRQDMANSTIPNHLKVLLLMASATETLSQQTYRRIRAIFAKHGIPTKDSETLSGINQYCKFIKMASYQFFERVDPMIIHATWGLGRDEDNPDGPVGDATLLDGFNADSNAIIRLVLLYCDRTLRNGEAFAKVFKTLRQLPSSGMIHDEDIARFKMK